jgi:hypothetical protein
MFQAPKTKKAVGWKTVGIVVGTVCTLLAGIAALATTFDIYRKHTAEAAKPAPVVEILPPVVEPPASVAETPLPAVPQVVPPLAPLAQTPAPSAQPEALMKKGGTPAAGKKRPKSSGKETEQKQEADITGSGNTTHQESSDNCKSKQQIVLDGNGNQIKQVCR